MKIKLQNAGKRFQKDWIFRGMNYEFSTGKAYAITGNNGSGKSTLLQCVAGATPFSAGDCLWTLENGAVLNSNKSDKIHEYFTYLAPYLDVIEEMTAAEFIDFHKVFKPLMANMPTEEVLAQVQLEHVGSKQIKFFSSGMKQRIKFAQAFFSQVPVFMLDEPCSNLDETGFMLYRDLIEKYSADKIIFVCSNDPNEYDFCDEKLDIRDFKPRKKL